MPLLLDIGIGQMLNNINCDYAGRVVSAAISAPHIRYQEDWLSPSQLSLAGWSRFGALYMTATKGKVEMGVGPIVTFHESEAVFWQGQRYPHGGPHVRVNDCTGYCGVSEYISYKLRDNLALQAQYNSSNVMAVTYNGWIVSVRYTF